jgi:hypothetical protein
LTEWGIEAVWCHFLSKPKHNTNPHSTIPPIFLLFTCRFILLKHTASPDSRRQWLREDDYKSGLGRERYEVGNDLEYREAKNAGIILLFLLPSR